MFADLGCANFNDLLVQFLVDQQGLVGLDDFAGQSFAVPDGGQFFAVGVGEVDRLLASSSKAT